MGAHLVIFIDETPSDLVSWRRVGDRGDILDGGVCSVEDLSDQGVDRCFLVLNGVLGSTRLVRIAAKSQSQLRQAAPFAIEDDVAVSVEDLHVSLGSDLGDGLRAVTVVDDALFAEWIKVFGELRIKLDGVFMDYALAPNEAGAMTVLQTSQFALLRSGDWGARLDAGIDQPTFDSICRAAMIACNVEDRVDQTVTDEALRDLLATRVQSAAVNLLQGRFATRSNSQLDLGGLKTVAGLAAGLFAMVIGGALLETAQLKSDTKSVTLETERIVKQAFPEVTRVVNPRVQVRQLVNEGASQGDEFLTLSSLLARGLKAAEDINIESMRYDGNRNTLTASIVFDDYADITSFKQAVTNAGGSLEEGGSREYNGRRLGDVTVTR